jgi:hypothetical protein
MKEALAPETQSILAAMEGLALPPLHTLTPGEARRMRAEAARPGSVEGRDSSVLAGDRRIQPATHGSSLTSSPPNA